MQNIDAIYLYKPPATEAEDATWTYFRLRGSADDRGTIQVSRVKWPSFEDRMDANGLADPIDTPGVAGYLSVPGHMQTLMKEQWGVDYKNSLLIGFIES